MITIVFKLGTDDQMAFELLADKVNSICSGNNLMTKKRVIGDRIILGDNDQFTITQRHPARFTVESTILSAEEMNALEIMLRKALSGSLAPKEMFI